jgi:signal transduction histidine kinase
MRHTEQARKVVRDLLDFARPRQATPGPTDIAAQAADLVAVLQPRARAVRAGLTLSAAPDLPLAQAGSDALEHILSNIVLNALDAVADSPPPPNGEDRNVRIALRPAEGGMLEIAVADNGPGIAPEHLDRVFDPFFTTKGVGKGTGLGLAVVYGLVHELGGRISASNDPEKGGAVFTVLLPVAADTRTEPEAKP